MSLHGAEVSVQLLASPPWLAQDAGLERFFLRRKGETRTGKLHGLEPPPVKFQIPGATEYVLGEVFNGSGRPGCWARRNARPLS